MTDQNKTPAESSAPALSVVAGSLLLLTAVCYTTIYAVLLSSAGNYPAAVGWLAVATLLVNSHQGDKLTAKAIQIASDMSDGWASAIEDNKRLLKIIEERDSANK